MMSPQRRRVYFAVIALGGLAMFLDRFVLDGGVTPVEGSPASMVIGPGSGPTSSPGTAPGSPWLSMPDVPFPRNLPPIDPGAVLRDFFLHPSIPPATPTAAKNAVPPDGHGPSGGRQAFVDQHRLDAVLISDDLEIAVINGTWFPVGRSIGGCRLESVSDNQARLSCPDGPVVLHVTGSGETPAPD